MDDFSAKPGEPNMFGLVGTKPIALHKKRMLSSMTPTIVEKTENYLWLWVLVVLQYHISIANHIKCL
jgi:gamma-glutamyltranspeptidase/glutathione hydrolase